MGSDIESELHTIGEELKRLNAQIAAIREVHQDERIEAWARRDRQQAERWSYRNTIEKLSRILSQLLDKMDGVRQ